METKTERTALSSVVAANIRAEAARRGLTQAGLCRLLGMSQPAMSDRYRERTPWTIDETEKVAELLGLELGDLMARPKGFEPLTFWLGADHTLTQWPAVMGWSLFCDDCGWRNRVWGEQIDETLHEHRWARHGGADLERAA